MNERLRILEMVESGSLSVEEGISRLERLAGTESGPGTDGTERVEDARSTRGPELSEESVAPVAQRIGWQVLFGVGVTTMAGGGLLLARIYGGEAARGLTWGWALFALGVLITGLGWWSRRAKWLTVRVREGDGRKFALALPLPLGLAAWVLRVAQPYLPQLQGTDADEAILALRQGLEDGGAVVFAVDEGQDGDKVEISIR